MHRHRQSNGGYEKLVLPYRQPKQTLVLRKRVHRVEHFDCNKDGQRHSRSRLGHVICEHLASNFREFARTLVEVGLIAHEEIRQQR